MRLYRFAFGLHDSADNLSTLALIPARNDSEAFDKGCALVGEDAPTIARRYWTRELGGWPDGRDPSGAFFTAEEIESVEDAEGLATDALSDVRLLERATP